ncbi:hypothetical protein [Yersinia mollaretii]|uniref:hypothetical protein n=1 Tax=Yersinia mollaretii TaxID=33060 RepID=UPI0005E95BE3|nr:hypothetical protein [Yersinia mollaretii]MDA5526788.1 hypothetical protein [Yersinia mollaretii]MDR7872182.1 hypothetical protein [Yersinia mollaretii]PHZ30125.1 hypothetical protein CS537_19020 [Yersinia mollaretii]WQC73294.1 hypothetical protein U1Z61_12530 [Yersinia mollaretii]CNF53251.1 exported protein [Yersinia mollaretii]
MTNTKKTSASVAAQAAQILKDPNASAIEKSLAGSALSQSRTDNQTGAHMEDVASQVLANPKYSEQTKTLAGSVLAQANKKR